MGVFPSMLSQWSTGVRPVPEEHATAIEFHTDFVVTVEETCPETIWYRIPDPAWPKGKPLIDKTNCSRPSSIDATAEVPACSDSDSATI
jgi:DNA-binding transcriptional regulator YdaS (Cro superfamily)